MGEQVRLPETPYKMLGGKDRVLAIANHFYDRMEEEEPALTATHRLTDHGLIHPDVRERFGLFLVGWLGGPMEYMERFGHPRLRMRHMHVPINSEMRDAWLRCMGWALDQEGVEGILRAYLNGRFTQVADFLRNVPD